MTHRLLLPTTALHHGPADAFGHGPADAHATPLADVRASPLADARSRSFASLTQRPSQTSIHTHRAHSESDYSLDSDRPRRAHEPPSTMTHTTTRLGDSPHEKTDAID